MSQPPVNSDRSARGHNVDPRPGTQPLQAAPLAIRHLRGYPLRNYRLTIAGRSLILSGPMRPEPLLAEPRIEDRFNADDYMPYWSDLWPASAGLADYMFASELRPAGPHRRAIEIGCGLGLAGVAAGMLGWQVVFTDYDVDALTYAVFNAAANGIGNTEARFVDWRSPPADLKADLLLAADVLYEKRMHGAMLGAIGAMLADGGVAIVADPGRDGAKGFGDAVRQAGFNLSMGNWADRQISGHAIPIDLYFLRKSADRQ